MTAATALKTAPRPQGSKALSLGRIPAAAQPQSADRLQSELWSVAGSLQGTADVLEQLHGLFDAIRKLGGKETQPLARIGANLAIEWADTLGATAERACALCNEDKADNTPATITAAVPPTGGPVTTLPMADYDAATLHLEKAETLAEMLGVLGCEGINELTPTGVTAAFDGLLGELVEIRAALVQGRKRGEA